MDIGIVGLGRMGSGIARRLMRSGHRVVGLDAARSSVEALATDGGEGADDLEDLVRLIDPPRAVWVMIPAGDPTEEVVSRLGRLLEQGDIIIDGGNSRYTDTIRRQEEVAQRGVLLVDVGTSGGIRGETEGYCLMVGGSEEPVERLRPIFEALAPAPELGWGRVGPVGAGHFVKMVHNGIEYGLMQAYAEGYAILEKKEEMALDLEQISRIWQNGSVVRSWLLELATELFAEDPALEAFSPYVEDSGEGRWTVAEAIDLDVPAPVITLSLLQRLRSREDHSFSDKVLSGLRNRFGGHPVKGKE